MEETRQEKRGLFQRARKDLAVQPIVERGQDGYNAQSIREWIPGRRSGM